MSNEITLYEGHKALVEAKRLNYEITAPNGVTMTLKRDVDFGVIPHTKKPSLYKAGAEKIAFAYGLMQRYHVETKIEQTDPEPFFFYVVRCDLVKLLPTGQEVVFTSGFGSSNTKEKRNGLNPAFDAANSTLKMAQKRALTSAAIAVCGGSDLFTQDIEDETFIKSGNEELITAQDDSAPITAKQVKRLFAIAGDAGKSVEEAKQVLAKYGYTSTKEITQEHYDEICTLLAAEKE